MKRGPDPVSSTVTVMSIWQGADNLSRGMAHRTPRNALAHIPGEDGWPVIGSTLELLADPKGFVEKRALRFGPVFRTRALGDTNVTLLGPEANEFFLLDPQNVLSSQSGWGFLLDKLFPRGLMLLDFDEHRLHRRALSVAFKAGPMRSYLDFLNAGIAASLSKWPRRVEMRVYPAMKQLTLDVAGASFLGLQLGPDTETLVKALSAMIAATVAPIRAALPGTKMREGVKARAYVVEYFKRQIPARRDSGSEDLFSHLCRATYEDGSFLTAQDVADHMNFFIMAAYDTVTSSLTTLVYRLAANPQWQEAVRDELRGQGAKLGEQLSYKKLESLPLTEMAFKEAMRMVPPVPSIPRRAVRDFEFKGIKIPAQTLISINPLYTHYMHDIWPEPERYDPMRFSEETTRGRHRYAYIPFSGGAHMCLGLNFAYMQAKCFAWHFLSSVRVSIDDGYRPKWNMWPIPSPRDGLRATLSPITN
jgi:cytochrome P450